LSGAEEAVNRAAQEGSMGHGQEAVLAEMEVRLVLEALDGE